jgi:hypothetical protein
MRRAWIQVWACLGCCSCVGTTGSDLIEFNTYAAGPEGAEPSQPLTFTTPRGWTVALTEAQLHIGAAYLDSAMPILGSQATSCILPGLYVASVPGGVDVDVLDGTPKVFSVPGNGSATPALAGELWLTGGDVNALDDSTTILQIAGSATRNSTTMPFEGQVTIGQNRAIPPSSPALPGANPICKQRIVSPIPVDMTPHTGGSLLVRIDPAGWFGNVDFSALEPSPSAPGTYAFSDDNSNQPSLNLFSGLRRASSQTYSFTWLNEAPK